MDSLLRTTRARVILLQLMLVAAVVLSTTLTVASRLQTRAQLQEARSAADQVAALAQLGTSVVDFALFQTAIPLEQLSGDSTAARPGDVRSAQAESETALARLEALRPALASRLDRAVDRYRLQAGDGTQGRSVDDALDAMLEELEAAFTQTELSFEAALVGSAPVAQDRADRLVRNSDSLVTAAAVGRSVLRQTYHYVAEIVTSEPGHLDQAASSADRSRDGLARLVLVADEEPGALAGITQARHHRFTERATSLVRSLASRDQPAAGEMEGAIEDLNFIRGAAGELTELGLQRLTTELADAEGTVNRDLLVTAALALAALVTAVSVPVIVDRSVSQPVSRLRAAAQRIRAGDRDVQLRTGADNEVGDLADAVASMVEQLDAAIAESTAANAAAVRADRAKSEFMSRMSHELRTPLNAILGFGQLLQVAELSRDHAESVTYIVEAGQRLLLLIDQVLQVAAVDAGKVTLSLETVEVDELLSDVQSGASGLAAAREVIITTPEATNLTVFTDRTRAAQAVASVVRLVLRHSHPGDQIAIDASIRPDGWIRLWVDGSVPTDMDPFELRSAGADDEGETAATFLAGRLVSLMGGAAGVDDTERGPRVWLELPAADPPGTPHPVSTSELIDGCEVLYIEDNLANVVLVERMLTDAGARRVHAATRVAAGLALLAEHRPPLVIVDLHLPDAHGATVVSAAAAQSPRPAIIVLTADASAAALRAAGADAVLHKPIEHDRFIAGVTHALISSGARSER